MAWNQFFLFVFRNSVAKHREFCFCWLKKSLWYVRSFELIRSAELSLLSHATISFSPFVNWSICIFFGAVVDLYFAPHFRKSLEAEKTITLWQQVFLPAVIKKRSNINNKKQHNRFDQLVVIKTSLKWESGSIKTMRNRLTLRTKLKLKRNKSIFIDSICFNRKHRSDVVWRLSGFFYMPQMRAILHRFLSNYFIHKV